MFGWELWFTYGLVDGLAVDMRRSNTLNMWLPLHINWLLNSLADAGTVSLGGLWLMWRFKKKDITIFKQWRWDAFIFLVIWCVGQNIIVELFLYQDHLSVGKAISLEYGDRTVMLQGQVPWLLMPAFLYKLVIYLNNKDVKRRD